MPCSSVLTLPQRKKKHLPESHEDEASEERHIGLVDLLSEATVIKKKVVKGWEKKMKTSDKIGRSDSTGLTLKKNLNRPSLALLSPLYTSSLTLLHLRPRTSPLCSLFSTPDDACCRDTGQTARVFESYD